VVNRSMKMKLLRTSLLAGVVGSMWLGAAAAQEAVVTVEEDEVELLNTQPNDEDASVQDKVVVVGSLIKRDEYSSISPVQIINADIQRDKGLIDATSILQSSPVSAGQQIDASFAGFVLDNGPGATTADLRGLGAGRTLVLVNGRRLAPAGVEGAPSSPDISLIPGGLVESYDLLLDGASSIYGSDAVAGVINATLRKDFDGLEMDFFHTIPDQGGGEETQFNATWGINGDRGFAGFGVEYFTRNTIKLSDRSFSDRCERIMEVTTNGQRRSDDLTLENDYPGMGSQPCDYFPLARRMSIQNSGLAAYQFGSLYYTPGSSNVGVPNFSESGDVFGEVVDGNGDGLADFSFYDYTTNGSPEDRSMDMLSGTETLSLFSYGEYSIAALNDMTAYYEASYSQRESKLKTGLAQLFPTVSGSNPFNPCNIETGTDCGAAFTNYLLNTYGISLADFGIPDAVEGASYDVQPIVTVRGDRDNVDVDLSQYRLVGGVKGSLPFAMPLIGNTWDYDVYASYSRSDGNSIRRGIRDDRLQLSLATTIEDPSNPGNYICGLDVDGDGIPDPGSTPGGCVPVNLFAPSLYNTAVGDFATQEERDYLFGVRTFATTYEQTVINGVISGDLVNLPGGMSKAAVGFEYRQDTLESRPDDVAADGLFYGFFNDEGASGSKDLYEAFAELELPLVANVPGIYELTTNISGRWTEEEYYGAAWTYSGKIGYRPVEWLNVTGTIGTSFRAPNVREQFLKAQTGFLTLTDPCVVPEAAFDIATGYNAANDPRDATTLANCQAAGIDPTTFAPNGAGNNTFSTEIVSGGGTDLDEETSNSWTAGLTFEQPWFSAFDFSARVTYYDIEIEGAIAEPSAQFIVNDCFTLQPTYPSSFCGRITRDSSDQSLMMISATPINVNSETAKGVDINFSYEQDVTLFKRSIGLFADLASNYKVERNVTQIDDEGVATVTEYVGRIAFPEWTGTLSAGARYGDWRMTWSSRYIGKGQQPDSDEFSNIIDGGSETCVGAANGDVDCRDVDFVDEFWTHDLSLGYEGDTFNVSVGVRNVFNEQPPLVNPDEYTTNGGNVPLGAGYNAGIFGRTAFIRVGKQF
jgi:iron complex outermembrane recepter protein